MKDSWLPNPYLKGSKHQKAIENNCHLFTLFDRGFGQISFYSFHSPPMLTSAALWTFGTQPLHSPLNPLLRTMYENAPIAVLTLAGEKKMFEQLRVLQSKKCYTVVLINTTTMYHIQNRIYARKPLNLS